MSRKSSTKTFSLERLDKILHTLSRDALEQRLERLYSDLLENQTALPLQTAPPVHLDSWLSLYLDELDNDQDPRASFPAIAQHLGECAQCRRAFEMLDAARATLRASRRVIFGAPPAQPTGHSELNAPWQRIAFPGQDMRRGKFQFLINPNPLRPNTLQPMAWRGEGVSETLLLSDQIILDTQPILVQAWLVPEAKRENYVAVRVTMQGPSSLTRNANVALTWGKHRYAAVFKRGQAKLKQVDASDLDSPISLTFDFPTHERPRRHSSTRPKPRAPKRATVQRDPQARKPRT